MHQGVVLHDGTDQIRRSYYPARSVILRDTASSPQPLQPSSNALCSSSLSSSPIPPTSPSVHHHSAAPQDASGVVGLGTSRIAERHSRSYMAPTASSQRKVFGTSSTECDVADGAMPINGSKRFTGRWSSPTPGSQHPHSNDGHDALAAVVAQRRYSTKARRTPTTLSQRTSDSDSGPDLAALLWWWTNNEDEARACLEAEEDFAWVTLMEHVMDVLAHSVLSVESTMHGPSALEETSTAAEVERGTCLARSLSDGVEGGGATSVQVAPQQTCGDSVAGDSLADVGRSQGDRLPSHSAAAEQDHRSAGDALTTTVDVDVKTGDTTAAVAVAAPPLPPALSEDLQQYLRAVHFRTVALSAEMLKMTQSQQSLQTSLRDAQAEIERLRTMASTSAHRSSSLRTDDHGLDDAASAQVPVHPALQQHATAAPPHHQPPSASSNYLSGNASTTAVVSHHDDLSSEREVLGVQGPGNIAKSVFLLLSYPMQCCLRFNHQNTTTTSSSSTPAPSNSVPPLSQGPPPPSLVDAAVVADPSRAVVEGASLPQSTSTHGGDPQRRDPTEHPCPEDIRAAEAPSSHEPLPGVATTSATAV